MRQIVSLVTIGVLLVVLTTGCGRAANFIPGDPETVTPAAADATPTPVVAPPILPPASLELGSLAGEAAVGEVIPDGQLAASVVQVQARALPAIPRNGSGVVIDTDQRLILTTYQLVNPYAPDGSRAYTSLAVGVAAPGESATVQHEAQVVAADPALDLAVLRVMRNADGSDLAPGAFAPPAVTLGDPDRLTRGDLLRVFGHPGLDPANPDLPQPVMTTEASLLGFRGDPTLSGRAWIKTDARLPYGHTGGPTFDEQGHLIGVAMQVVYAQGVPIGQVRPLDLAGPLLAEAREAGPEAVYRAPLHRRSLGPLPSEGTAVAVSPPAFAGNAVAEAEGGDLFDYTTRFPSPLQTLHYEYALQGVQPGALVEERWFLNGVLQDGFSSSFTWAGGAYALLTDRVVAANERGLQPGIWQLDVWVDEIRRASASASIGVDPPAVGGQPDANAFQFASTASLDHQPAAPPSAGAGQLLGFFNYSGAGAVRQVRWVVFRDGALVYQSPLLAWEGGDAGNWWVGYAGDLGAVGAGFWEIEIYFDNVIAGVDGTQLF